MRIAICDDNRREREEVINAIRGWDPTRSAGCFPDGASLFTAAQKSPCFDIVFLNIYMPGENGIDVAEQLLLISPRTGILFVTTGLDHAVSAFSLHALHYLVKPVTTKGVVEAFRRLSKLQNKRRPIDYIGFREKQLYCIF